MTYTWDPKKNRRNVARHGIAFEAAVKIFEGPTLEKVDDRLDYGEVRVYAIGMVNLQAEIIRRTDRDSSV